MPERQSDWNATLDWIIAAFCAACYLLGPSFISLIRRFLDA